MLDTKETKSESTKAALEDYYGQGAQVGTPAAGCVENVCLLVH